VLTPTVLQLLVQIFTQRQSVESAKCAQKKARENVIFIVLRKVKYHLKEYNFSFPVVWHKNLKRGCKIAANSTPTLNFGQTCLYQYIFRMVLGCQLAAVMLGIGISYCHMEIAKAFGT